MLTCRRCGKEFPFKVKIDGVVRNLKSRKFCLVCSPFGRHNTQPSVEDLTPLPFPERKVVCSECGKEYVYQKTREGKKRRGHGRRVCASCRTSGYRRELKKRAVEYMGGSCRLCGYSKCLRAMVFHHAGEKDFMISHQIRAWDQVKQELDRCVLLCSNCHAEVHSGVTVLAAK